MAKAVASIALMVVFTGLFTLRVGTTADSGEADPPDRRRGSSAASASRATACGSPSTIVAITVVLAAVYRFTRFGLVTRAAAETEKGAYVSGISPDRIAAVNWMISAAVAAASGILIAPIVPLTPIGYTLFIVPALAAAVIGQFTLHGRLPCSPAWRSAWSSPRSVYLSGQHSWLPTSGLAELVPLLLILLVFVARASRCRAAA